MLLSGVASLSGNMLQLMLLLLHRELRSDTLSLTLSCCFSDIALGLSAFPFAIYHGLTPPSGPPSEGVLCQGGGFLLLLLQTSSLHSLAWASVDKFLEICLALSYGSLVTAARCRAVLLLLWSVCLGGAVLPLLGFGCYAYSEASFLCGPSFSPAHRAFVLLWVGGGLGTAAAGHGLSVRTRGVCGEEAGEEGHFHLQRAALLLRSCQRLPEELYRHAVHLRSVTPPRISWQTTGGTVRS
ncbi:hypothetical protein PBY51_011257 [Eleginops maclovinus]|nr:hypothetical protein PBY51_011257 [Eleginops maclovinus]